MQGKAYADRPDGYGSISKILHWSMAGLFFWQFAGALLRVFAKDTPIEGFFWGTHESVGFTLWLLVFVRGVWSLINMRNRPKPEGSLLQVRLARAMHFAMYVLMLIVPTLAILRSIGSGRGMRVYGVQIVEGGGQAIPALTAPGSALHGLLGWTLLALIIGHIGAALYHHVVRGDATLTRMAPVRG